MNEKQNSSSVAGNSADYFSGTKMGEYFDKITKEDTKHSEGPIAKAIESQTTKLPSDTFLWLALGSIGVSAALQVMGQKERSNFVGQWAPAFLVLGLYNKMVKILGSEPSLKK